ncbi:class IV adenylate cyclase [Kutzneria buriramensis]|uniref:Adenylate cyclase class 2 n=1 Tax=Kutzneria buriramensis TaxID=1045776 RepID=A0A3E0I9P2_9PSEU|nr:class IV adenylate cyclase [Kutzneria buriramensis]REH55453.1 adenylate cyclase class 2 [Kutzneria buriramensis]
MTVEAELKARLRNPEQVRQRLAERAPAEHSVYADHYFDYPDRRLSAAGYEVRLRTITDDAGNSGSLLTFKEPAVDAASGSKPEHETPVDDPNVVTKLVTVLGLVELIAFEKRCTNFRFTEHGRDLVATVVEVPELDGETFVEVETLTTNDDVDDALVVVRCMLNELGVSATELTTETYTGAVAAKRHV